MKGLDMRKRFLSLMGLLVFGMAGLLAAAAVPLFRTETAGRH